MPSHMVQRTSASERTAREKLRRRRRRAYMSGEKRR